MTAAAPSATAKGFEEVQQSLSRDVIDVTQDVACVPLSIVNAYLIGEPGAGDREWTLVDAGLFFSAGKIISAAAERFGPKSRPAGIVLTHGHFDHVGAVKELAELWDCPVYAHPLEMPYITGKSSYPPPDPTVGGGAMSLMSPLYPRGPIDLGNRAFQLPVDRTIPDLPGWRWVPTPGHSPGHISLFRESDRVLIAGDAIVTTKQESLLGALLQPLVLQGPPKYFTPDWDAARESLREINELRPRIAATGHGKPMSGVELREGLEQLAEHFDEVARPRTGRYINKPAETDVNGVKSLPKAIRPNLLLYLTAGLVVGMIVWSYTRKKD